MNTPGEFYVALENLRTSIENKIENVDRRQREDLAELRAEVNEVKKTVDINHTQLVRVESQLTATDNAKAFKLLKQQVVGGFALVFATVIGLAISWYQISSDRHHDTATRIEENYKHIDETAEQTLEKAKRSVEQR